MVHWLPRSHPPCTCGGQHVCPGMRCPWSRRSPQPPAARWLLEVQSPRSRSHSLLVPSPAQASSKQCISPILYISCSFAERHLSWFLLTGFHWERPLVNSQRTKEFLRSFSISVNSPFLPSSLGVKVVCLLPMSQSLTAWIFHAVYQGQCTTKTLDTQFTLPHPPGGKVFVIFLL